MNIANALDVVFLSFILLCAVDALRHVKPWHQPIWSAVLASIAIGSFCLIADAIQGTAIPGWVVAGDFVFAIYFAAILGSASKRKERTVIDRSNVRAPQDHSFKR